MSTTDENERKGNKCERKKYLKRKCLPMTWHYLELQSNASALFCSKGNGFPDDWTLSRLKRKSIPLSTMFKGCLEVKWLLYGLMDSFIAKKSYMLFTNKESACFDINRNVRGWCMVSWTVQSHKIKFKIIA